MTVTFREKIIPAYSAEIPETGGLQSGIYLTPLPQFISPEDVCRHDLIA
ncbi:hypothetical protein CSB69_3287 [Morganella morganii]|nr:hypothetical protein CSB69_3287 [Morganella morganii]EMP53284.1 hypothetical protein C790_01475 [Morganella morganii SC01]